MNILNNYTKEELTPKMFHMLSFLVSRIALAWNERITPENMIVRSEEAQQEDDHRIRELVVAIFPSWDIVEKIYPHYEELRPWVTKIHEDALVKPCACEGCVK
ncbi:MAG: hypothetical protein ACRDL7_04165 [Gaiellaceae bacterium]